MGASKSKTVEVSIPPILNLANQNQSRQLKSCLARGHNVNSMDSYGTTTLHVAAEHGYLECLQILCEHGANLNQTDNSGLTALLISASNGHRDCVVHLLQQKANPDIKDIWGRTALHKAIINRHYHVANLLINHGCNINEADTQNRVVLHAAASYGQVDLVDKLIEAGAIIDAQDARGRTPFYLAVLGKHVDVVKLLVTHGCNMDLARTSSVTPLSLATQKGCADLVRLLLQLGASVTCTHSETEISSDPIYSAILRAGNADKIKFQDCVKIVEMLIQANAEGPEEAIFWYLYRALKCKPCEETLNNIQLLLIAGCQPNRFTLTVQTKYDFIISDLLATFLTKPLSLKDLCRRSIRKQLQCCYPNVLFGVQKLDIPSRLRNLIALQEH